MFFSGTSVLNVNSFPRLFFLFVTSYLFDVMFSFLLNARFLPWRRTFLLMKELLAPKA